MQSSQTSKKVSRVPRWDMEKTMKATLVKVNINGVIIECTQEQAIAIASACGNSKATKTTNAKTPKKATAKKAPKDEVRVLSGKVTSKKLQDLYYEEGVRKVEIEGSVFELSTDSDGLVYQKATKKAQKESSKEAPKKLADFEPKKYDGFYRWGSKHDGFNQKSYMGLRKAYCVYKATNGQFLDSNKAYEAGIKIDYSEGGAYYKAKAEFEKKFVYVKKSDR